MNTAKDMNGTQRARYDGLRQLLTGTQRRLHVALTENQGSRTEANQIIRLQREVEELRAEIARIEAA